MSKRSFVLVMAFALAAVLATGGLLASNMGFKVNRTLNGAGANGAAVGENHISLPFNPQLGMSNASDLLDDVENGDTNLAINVQRFDPTADQRESWFGGKIGGVNFSLVACESYFVTITAGLTTDYIIVGSHDPTVPCTFNGTGIAGFTVNEQRVAEALERNPILVTALNAVIGYERGAAIAKQAYAEGRPIIEVAMEETDLDEERLRQLLDPAALTRGGIRK